jgi:hypothetical protein
MYSFIDSRNIGFGCSRMGAEEDIWAKTEKVTGKWRRLHKEQLYALHSSSNVIRAIKL